MEVDPVPKDQKFGPIRRDQVAREPLALVAPKEWNSAFSKVGTRPSFDPLLDVEQCAAL
jgi:hypothetical protein